MSYIKEKFNIERADSGWLRLFIVILFITLDVYVFYLVYNLILKGLKGEFKILITYNQGSIYITSLVPGIIFVMAGVLILSWGLPKTLNALLKLKQ